MFSVIGIPECRRVLAWLGLFLLGPLAAAQTQLPGIDAKWRHLRSEHFELYSRNSETESRRLLQNLELVHAIFFEVNGFKPVRAVPITVYFFSRDRHFEFYKPDAFRKLENLGTFYHSEPDRGILTVAPLPSYEAAQQLAFGSYTYHLFRLLGQSPPPWYKYGTSWIFRNLVINSKEFELGRPDPAQVARLREARLIPVEIMFGSDHTGSHLQSDEANRRFQDQSWALVHYFFFGAHKLPKPAIASFVNYTLQQGRHFNAERTRQTFEQTLGMDYVRLNRELQGYFRNGRYGYGRYPLPAVAPSKSYAVRSVTPEEIQLRLAELALRVNGSALGRLHLLHAADRPDEAARVQEALASAAVREGDWDHAAERWERALAAGSDNIALIDELLQYESRKLFHRFSLHYRLPAPTAEKLRGWLARSIAAVPDQVAAYEIMAWVEATAEEPRIANVNLVQSRYPHLLEKQRTLLALLMVRLRLNDQAGAGRLLASLESMATDLWIHYAIETTRAEMEARPADYSKLPPMNSGNAGPGGPVRIRVNPPTF